MNTEYHTSSFPGTKFEIKNWETGKKGIPYRERVPKENLLQYIDEVDMSNRNKEIIQKFYSSKITLRELGAQYGIGGERVRQILVRYAVKSHKLYMRDQNDDK